jgi:outer membrane protein assembly factor BamD (BamD/ComL family)
MFLRRIIVFLSWALLFGVTQQAMAAAAPLLDRMTKEDGLASSRIMLHFSALPEYRIETSGQRIDLFFSASSAAPTLQLLPEDDKIVKILLAKSQKELMVSLLLRQIPANLTVAANQATATVELELFWQEAGGSRPAIAFRISGLPSRQSSTSSSKSMIKSKFNGQWHRFFSEYQTPLLMNLPLKISLPILPRFGLEEASPSFAAILKTFEDQEPQKAFTLLQKLSSAELSHEGLQKKQLLQAEALLRNGSAQQSLIILENFPEKGLSPELQQRVGYLHNLALALTDDHYGAMAWHADLEKLLGDGPYRHPLQLLQAEIALLKDDGPLALKKLLWQNSHWPKALRFIRQLRIADAQVATGQSREALATYQKLIKDAELPADDLYSFQQAAQALFDNQQWEQAHLLYQRLSTLLQGADATSQALFLSSLATYHNGDQQSAMLQFRLLREDFPGTTGDLRSWLKMLDHGLVTMEERHLLQGLRDYPVMLSLTPDRRLREEILLKLGITLHLHGEPLRAIETLGKFRRNFASSPLRAEAEALMAEILPPELEYLIAKGEDLQAVILLEKYRELLIRGDGKWPFLPKLANAFTRLGLFDRGCRVYLYLMDHAKSAEDAESFYLPLASLYYDRDEYLLVEKYSKAYLKQYPEGADRTALFLLRLRALYKLARFEEAAELLQEKQYPRSSEIELLAAQIYWELGDYNQVIDFANRLGDRGEAIPPFGLLLEAEALRRLGHAKQALPLYEVLAEEGTFGDQATYRCGQILLAKGERARALKLFQNLVEKGKNDLWQQLASDYIAAETY